MLTERTVHPDVRALLMAGTPFKYAHLIKFERPSRPEDATGAISTSAQRYTYLTDASRNVDFDDLSVDQSGIANGTQTYIANKVLQVTDVPESIEAQASSFNLSLAGNGVGAVISFPGVTITNIDATHWDIAWPSNADVVATGFRTGDKVTLSGLTAGDVNIESFRANNVTRVKKIDTNIGVGTGSVTMSLSSEEIKSILLDKMSPNYASFINREVFIYRAYFVNGVLVGQTPVNGVTGPVLLFKGIISDVSFEDTDTDVKVNWGLSSNWADFQQVKGRITSDQFHRALDENGVPQPNSAIKPVYAFDKGFSHADTTVNAIAMYTTQTETQKVKAKNGFLGLGIGAKVKVSKGYVTNQVKTTLDFQLSSKSIPVIYGVRSIEGIPIFADTLLADASNVYVAYVLGEGEMGGIYDVNIESDSSVCRDKADFDVRSVQTPDRSIAVVCVGRADRGDVLAGTGSISSTTQPFYAPVATTVSGTYDPNDLATNPSGLTYNYNYYNTYHSYIAPSGASASPAVGGVTNGQSIHLSTQQYIVVDYFSGREDQVAAPSLVTIAANSGFKIQNDYWKGGGAAEYWGPNHRLIDSAYVIVNYKIAEGSTTLPSLTFVCRGKGLDCYNYDYSYTHDDKSGSESPDNFKLGQVVTLKKSTDNSIIAANVQIIDKWTIVRADGTADTRFRWSTNPDLAVDNEGKPTITKFYMTDGTHNWTMVTHNYVIESGTVPTLLSAPVTSITPADPSTGGTNINIPSTPWVTIGGVGGSTPAVSFYNNDGSSAGGGVHVGGIGSNSNVLHVNKA